MFFNIFEGLNYHLVILVYSLTIFEKVILELLNMNLGISLLLSVVISIAIIKTPSYQMTMNVLYNEPYRVEDWYYELESESGKTRRLLETFGNESVFTNERTNTEWKGTNVYHKSGKSVHTFNNFVVTIMPTKKEENIILVKAK